MEWQLGNGHVEFLGEEKGGKRLFCFVAENIAPGKQGVKSKAQLWKETDVREQFAGHGTSKGSMEFHTLLLTLNYSTCFFHAIQTKLFN